MVNPKSDDLSVSLRLTAPLIQGEQNALRADDPSVSFTAGSSPERGQNPPHRRAQRARRIARKPYSYTLTVTKRKNFLKNIRKVLKFSGKLPIYKTRS